MYRFQSHLVLGFLAIALAAVFETDSSAQNIRRYQPATPTLSPWLNLLGREGVLPNYYSLVRPMERQQQFNQQSMAFRAQQQLINRQLETQLAQPTGIIPTGTHGTFQNTSHFFPQSNFGRR